jgi:hypothetical protein
VLDGRQHHSAEHGVAHAQAGVDDLAARDGRLVQRVVVDAGAFERAAAFGEPGADAVEREERLACAAGRGHRPLGPGVRLHLAGR